MKKGRFEAQELNMYPYLTINNLLYAIIDAGDRIDAGYKAWRDSEQVYNEYDRNHRYMSDMEMNLFRANSDSKSFNDPDFAAKIAEVYEYFGKVHYGPHREKSSFLWEETTRLKELADKIRESSILTLQKIAKNLKLDFYRRINPTMTSYELADLARLCLFHQIQSLHGDDRKYEFCSSSMRVDGIYMELCAMHAIKDAATRFLSSK